ncbi:hypothetical protein DCPSUM001_01050 [Dysgonomonas capnocytophagoides]|nr:hypothetical protein DCPSUM001_01050 [Dysgonomonas capnocytophagoides]
MKDYKISFIYNNNEYSFIESLDENQVRFSLILDCRSQIVIYMTTHKLKGSYVLTGMKEI